MAYDRVTILLISLFFFFFFFFLQLRLMRSELSVEEVTQQLTLKVNKYHVLLHLLKVLRYSFPV